MIRPLMGTTWEVRQVRDIGLWVRGRGKAEGKRSRAASMGMMSPSWTLCCGCKDQSCDYGIELTVREDLQAEEQSTVVRSHFE